jgi:hypothetical protein
MSPRRLPDIACKLNYQGQDRSATAAGCDSCGGQTSGEESPGGRAGLDGLRGRTLDDTRHNANLTPSELQALNAIMPNRLPIL